MTNSFSVFEMACLFNFFPVAAARHRVSFVEIARRYSAFFAAIAHAKIKHSTVCVCAMHLQSSKPMEPSAG